MSGDLLKHHWWRDKIVETQHGLHPIFRFYLKHLKAPKHFFRGIWFFSQHIAQGFMYFSVDWTYFLYTQHIYIYREREIDNLQSSLEKNPQGMRLEPYVHHELFWRLFLLSSRWILQWPPLQHRPKLSLYLRHPTEQKKGNRPGRILLEIWKGG